MNHKDFILDTATRQARLDEMRRRVANGPSWAEESASTLFGGDEVASKSKRDPAELQRIKDTAITRWKEHAAKLVATMERQLSWGS